MSQLWLLLTLVMAGVVPAAFAQSPTPPTPAAAIPAPDLADRSTATATALRATNNRTRPDPRLDSIRSGLKQVSVGIRDLSALSTHSSPDAATLDEVSSTLQLVGIRVDAWATQLKQLANELEHDRTALAQSEKEWTQTLASSEASGLPPLVRNRVAVTLGSVQASQTAIAVRRGEVLSLQSEIAEQQINARQLVEEVRRQQGHQREALVAVDSAPLWKLAAAPRLNTAAKPVFKLSSETNPLARDYVISVVESIAAFCVIAFLVWLLLRRVRNQGENWKSGPEPSVQALSVVVLRPVSASLFLAVAIGALAVHNPAPWMVGLAALILLIPSVRLLPALTAPDLDRAFHALATLLVVFGLARLLPAASVWSRLIWLVLQLATAAFLWWLLRLLRQRARPGLWPFFIRTLTSLSILLLALAILAGIVNNFVSGLILLFERPLQVGDSVAIGSIDGQVKGIGIRSSVIRSGEGADIIVPNAKLISSDVTNWTHAHSSRRVDIVVATSSEAGPGKVVDLLTTIAKEHESVLVNPEPVALLTGFSDGSLEFTLRFWCTIADWGALGSEIRTRIIDNLKQAQIPLPYPQRSVYVRTAP